MSEPTSYPCPECGHTRRTVIDTRNLPRFVRRRSRCANCGAEYTTYETPALETTKGRIECALLPISMRKALAEAAEEAAEPTKPEGEGE